ncbi:hypothetical protein BG006_002285 [Podila minutissima]|uniref:F-box domain-containing protein n=1 Tax=Podila minutissima TaxID=64525 RepID=A0A9P5SD62_9FUNG|nr:hypothetical protein BG006_002285 [Podila minutissima]
MSFLTPIALPSLPTEVLEIILTHLSQPDLTQCVRVSHAWNKALVPYLWRTLAIHSRHSLKRFITNEAQQALRRNATFVRELHLVHKALYDKSLPCRKTLISDPGVMLLEVYTISLFTNLRALELEPVRLVRPNPEFDLEIFALVRQNPHLRRLLVNVKMDPKTLINLVTKHTPHLGDLDLVVSWRGDVKALLDCLPECIRTVRLRNVVHDAPSNAQGKTSDASDASTTLARHHHALESLHVAGNLAGKQEEVLVPFLESCSPKLKSVGGTGGGMGSYFFGNARIAKILSNLGIVCKELSQYTLPNNVSDADLAELIAANSEWTNIELYTRQVGPQAAAAIVECCEHLEALDIMHNGARGLSGFHLQAVLGKATKLRSLQAHWLLNTDKITAMNILSSQWATTSLEHMDLKIEVQRAIQASRSVQRQVLRRLGQQKKLRKLVIGGMTTDLATGEFVHQRDCLEMTLESGIDELVDLKNLEVLDIHHMDHRAGVPELEWMVANLPRLQILIGMLDTLRPPSDEVREWLSTHRPSWR